MYGLPKDIDLNFLRGKPLEMVCFAAYTVYLHFSEQVLITVEGSFQHSKLESSSGDLKCPLTESHLMSLIGAEVMAIEGGEDGTLQLRFSNGHMLRINGDNGPYEAFHIKNGSTIITV